MRNGGQNKRMRNNHNRNRKGQNPMTRVFESNGPDVKIRGTSAHIADKYVQLARDALSSGDPVSAENYYQHAEHYFRIIAAAQEQFRQSQPSFYRNENESRDEDEDSDDVSGYANEPGLVMRDQPQQFEGGEHQNREHHGREHHNRDRHNRDNHQRYQNRDNREQREHHQPRDPQPYREAAPLRAPQPVIQEADIERLPSFITGGQAAAEVPAASGQPNERFPRRRRRPSGPRPENQGGAAEASDVAVPE